MWKVNMKNKTNIADKDKDNTSRWEQDYNLQVIILNYSEVWSLLKSVQVYFLQQFID